jgi:hypothetical protein
VSATGAAESALINEAQFHRELRALQETDKRAFVAPLSGHGPDSPESSTFSDAFDALDQGLGSHGLDSSPPLPAHHERGTPANGTRDEFVGTPLTAEPRISATVAALVIIGCVLAGAVAALYVRSSPPTAISAPRAATR